MLAATATVARARRLLRHVPVRSGLRRPPKVALAYAAVLGLGALVLAATPPATRERLLDASSTDIPHLLHDPWLVLPASAVWVTGLAAYWLPFSMLAVAAVERMLGAAVTAALVLAVHTVATLASEGLLWARVAAGGLSAQSLHVLDVGPSYVVIAAVGAALVLAPRRRVLLLLTLSLPVLASSVQGLPALQVAAVGHVVSLTLGAAGAVLARALRAPAPTPTPPSSLLAVGGADLG